MAEWKLQRVNKVKHDQGILPEEDEFYDRITAERKHSRNTLNHSADSKFSCTVIKHMFYTPNLIKSLFFIYILFIFITEIFYTFTVL